MSASILIAGGGIGGLAAALGAAIQLGSNAFHGFDTLGIGAAAHAMAVHIDQLRLMNAMAGEEIARVPLDGPFRRRIGDPYAVVHLGDLHGVLLRACHENDLIESRTSAQVTAYAQDGCSVTATLASGERVSGTALIRAHGLWSNIPQKVVGDGLPRVSCGGVGLASHGVATDGATAKAA